ncbi:HGWP repeat containing protein-like [Oryza sativa Japonica Group]|uniref:HGWP repeat containing protein-like n=1 Tax=Oryza sativa subsp. japonica TaxID=39947 RepID=Q5ZBG0_ORYSJ|nr:HGWP repeat containing protein-like [Oryza sativa Japonica Group]BAD61530.1 HGWP repeat containing protein-like [Oryza sativa Japonica Group]
MAAAAFTAADWCFRLHGWPIMSPLMGVYVFTDRPPHSPPTGVLVYTVGWSYHCCWASMSLPLAASPAADWCLRLYGWLVTPLLLSIYVFTDRLDFVCHRLVFSPSQLACYAAD